MENHPIPKDITGFQFKLVGNMTVRQFIYVGVGVFLAWLIYFVLKFPLYLSLPLALFFSLGGAALAFLPIDGRPMDVMIKNFIKSVIAPTQYLYEKQGGSAFSPGQTNVNSQVSQAIPNPNQVSAEGPAAPASPPSISATPTPPEEDTSPPSAPISEQKLETQEEGIKKEENELEAEIQAAQSQHQDASTLEQKLNDAMRQKEELEKELSQLKATLTGAPLVTPPLPQQHEVPVNPTATTIPQTFIETSPVVFNPISQPPLEPKRIDQPAIPGQSNAPPVSAPIPGVLPEEPNVVKGTVKDSRGNPLQNILVEVKDEEANPVRAFKTNGKGEFASATSLPNGNYTVVLEDPKMVHKFDTSSITATGGALTPLGIISIDPREELRRELFN